jgi:toxin ParE1/3/4
MKIVWSPEAASDLAALRAFIAREDPQAARRMALRILDRVETTLSKHPEIGRPGRVSGTRELVVPHTPYIAPYRIRDGAIEIIRVFHAARRWPKSL